MKSICFDTTEGFSPTMALGALLDMTDDTAPVNTLLHSFGASVFTERVTRGHSEATLAHIDISDQTDEKLENISGEDILRKAGEFKRLSPRSDSREILEALCVCSLIEELEIDSVYFRSDYDKPDEFGKSVCTQDSGSIAGTDIDGIIGNLLNPDSESPVTDAGYELLKLLGASDGTPFGCNVISVGYGADSGARNQEGVLRAVMYGDADSEPFFISAALDELFKEESATI